MANAEILNLKPQCVWAHFYELTQIPRPTGHMKEVTQFIADFGKSLDLETEQGASPTMDTLARYAEALGKRLQISLSDT